MIADILKISSKTVESYIAGAKDKLGCYRRSDLIATILDSDFFENVDFD